MSLENLGEGVVIGLPKNGLQSETVREEYSGNLWLNPRDTRGMDKRILETTVYGNELITRTIELTVEVVSAKCCWCNGVGHYEGTCVILTKDQRLREGHLQRPLGLVTRPRTNNRGLRKEQGRSVLKLQNCGSVTKPSLLVYWNTVTFIILHSLNYAQFVGL